MLRGIFSTEWCGERCGDGGQTSIVEDLNIMNAKGDRPL